MGERVEFKPGGTGTLEHAPGVLAADLRRISEELCRLGSVSDEDVPAALACVNSLRGQLDALRDDLFLRRVVLAAPRPAPTDKEERLTVKQAASRLGRSKWWLYKHKAELPFMTNQGRNWFASARGLDRYIRQAEGRR